MLLFFLMGLHLTQFVEEEIDLQQIKCIIDSNYQRIQQMIGGIPDIFQPPVYYTLDGQRLQPSPEVSNYFIRNYGGFQVLSLRDDLLDRALEVHLFLPDSYKIQQENFYDRVLDQLYVGTIFVISPEFKNQGGGFLHYIIFRNVPDYDIKLRYPQKQQAMISIKDIGRANVVYVCSFVISSKLHVPSSQHLNLIFQEINIVTHTLTPNCDYGAASECESTDLSFFADQIQEQIDKSRGDVPKIMVNHAISIEFAAEDNILEYDTKGRSIDLPTFQYMGQMNEESGFYVFCAEVQHLDQILAKIDIFENLNGDMVDFYHQAYQGSFLRAYGNKRSINIFTMCRYQEDFRVRYLISDSSMNFQQIVYIQIYNIQQVGRFYVFIFECYEGYVINDKRAKEIFKALTFLIESVDVKYEIKMNCQVQKTDVIAIQKVPLGEIDIEPQERFPNPPQSDEEYDYNQGQPVIRQVHQNKEAQQAVRRITEPDFEIEETIDSKQTIQFNRDDDQPQTQQLRRNKYEGLVIPGVKDEQEEQLAAEETHSEQAIDEAEFIADLYGTMVNDQGEVQQIEIVHNEEQIILDNDEPQNQNQIAEEQPQEQDGQVQDEPQNEEQQIEEQKDNKQQEVDEEKEQVFEEQNAVEGDEIKRGTSGEQESLTKGDKSKSAQEGLIVPIPEQEEEKQMQDQEISEEVDDTPRFDIDENGKIVVVQGQKKQKAVQQSTKLEEENETDDKQTQNEQAENEQVEDEYHQSQVEVTNEDETQDYRLKDQASVDKDIQEKNHDQSSDNNQQQNSQSNSWKGKSEQKDNGTMESGEEEKECLILTSNYKEPTPEPEDDKKEQESIFKVKKKKEQAHSPKQVNKKVVEQEVFEEHHFQIEDEGFEVPHYEEEVHPQDAIEEEQPVKKKASPMPKTEKKAQIPKAQPHPKIPREPKVKQDSEEFLLFEEEEEAQEVEEPPQPKKGVFHVNKKPKEEDCEPKGDSDIDYKALYESILKGNNHPAVVHSNKRDVNINIIVN